MPISNWHYIATLVGSRPTFNGIVVSRGSMSEVIAAQNGVLVFLYITMPA